MRKIDVVIPARNEERTISAIVRAFRECPGIGKVIVSVDADTSDHTAFRAAESGAHVLVTRVRGKGQVVRAGLSHVVTRQTILCDADYTGLTTEHVEKLLGKGHRVGVPDLPMDDILKCQAVIDRPEWFNGIIRNWAVVSGFRNVPTRILQRLELHGYLTEVQINYAIHIAGIDTHVFTMNGLRSPFIMSDVRVMEMNRDRQWGIVRGVLKGKE